MGMDVIRASNYGFNTGNIIAEVSDQYSLNATLDEEGIRTDPIEIQAIVIRNVSLLALSL